MHLRAEKNLAPHRLKVRLACDLRWDVPVRGKGDEIRNICAGWPCFAPDRGCETGAQLARAQLRALRKRNDPSAIRDKLWHTTETGGTTGPFICYRRAARIVPFQGARFGWQTRETIRTQPKCKLILDLWRRKRRLARCGAMGSYQDYPTVIAVILLR